MASSIAVSRLHLRGRTCLLNCLQKVDTFLHRGVGTDAAVAQAQTTERDGSEAKDGRRSLLAVQDERREQAEKSVLISCQSRPSEKKFLKYLSRHGDVNKYFFYESYGVYAVVEFASRDGVASLIEAATIPSVSHESMVPFKSRLLSLRSVDSLNHQSGLPCQPQTSVSISELVHRLSSEDSVEQQITSLTEAFQLTEENSRLRFLVCSLLNDIAAAYFPECTIRPFGSSVNGFGKLGCDLDMFLDLDSISGWNVKQPKAGLLLEYQMKRANSERAVTQSILSVIGECVDQFGPGCVGVQRILNARCPLVRFSHQPSGFQCDLTANNRVAMISTELLYLYGELDPRVRHLVFTIRCWARAHGITSSIPGAWISNFSLTVMVLFFLQKRNPPIIPTLNHLRDLAGPADNSVIEGHDCTFVRDFSKIHLQRNSETLETLLCEFFVFYATFPFSRMSINIRKGKEQNKPEVAPLHIQNPFETSLNVSKNVNATQLSRFVALCQESSWLIQQSERNSPKSAAGESSPTPWGLAALLLPSQVEGMKSRKKRRREPVSETIKSLLESLKNKNQGKKR
ncbi:poly(A) RNA polymerase, mitochondrial [Nothobranchius furzeri]|uniref:Mitochondrial poly(A) polymerase n=4 Tax=Nothobranchius TaxID=28779 RepID=A0A1A8A627_NOTFU|nr:poly(A) RNA polymerase, mitochondrial [Nothobranchius furzeri]KAF7212987.1 mitochondrial poly(A) polymerase [Nothobranchius furzeri]